MIYAARLEDGTVKISMTHDLGWTLAGIEARTGRKPVLLGTKHGGPGELRRIHRRLEPLRIGKSHRFRAGPELAAVIGRG